MLHVAVRYIIYGYIIMYVLAWYGMPSTALWRKRSDVSVLLIALVMSAILMTESWATNE